MILDLQKCTLNVFLLNYTIMNVYICLDILFSIFGLIYHKLNLLDLNQNNFLVIGTFVYCHKYYFEPKELLPKYFFYKKNVFILFGIKMIKYMAIKSLGNKKYMKIIANLLFCVFVNYFKYFWDNIISLIVYMNI